jgi:hypothetical protein
MHANNSRAAELWLYHAFKASRLPSIALRNQEAGRV